MKFPDKIDELMYKYLTERSKEIPEKVYHKMSSDGSKTYEVKKYSDGKIWCNCPAYKFKRKCRHTRELGFTD